MCGRFVRESPVDVIAEAFEATAVAGIDLRPRYNVCPGEEVAAIVGTDEGRRLGKLRWGLDRQINFRSETIARRPRYGELVRKHRCLVVADGFYEWQSVGSRKLPYLIRPRSGRPFGLAAIWDWRPGPRGAPIAVCGILTCAPNDLVAPIHDRMPVVLAADGAGAWLDPRISDPAVLSTVFAPFPGEALEMRRVSTLVNTPRNDSPECVRPVAPEVARG